MPDAIDSPIRAILNSRCRQYGSSLLTLSDAQSTERLTNSALNRGPWCCDADPKQFYEEIPTGRCLTEERTLTRPLWSPSEFGLIMLRSKVHAALMGLFMRAASNPVYEWQENLPGVTTPLKELPAVTRNHCADMSRQSLCNRNSL